MKAYLIMNETDSGVEFSKARGRNSSVNSIAAFNNLETAERALKYRDSSNQSNYKIVEVTGYKELEVE